VQRLAAPQHKLFCNAALIAILLSIHKIPAQFSVLGRFRKVTAMSILRFLQSWRRYNASLRELSHLDDRELADIGISRSDIPRVALDAANS
jgi:uncharacterized protein YjiS (DUF1127 family)